MEDWLSIKNLLIAGVIGVGVYGGYKGYLWTKDWIKGKITAHVLEEVNRKLDQNIEEEKHFVPSHGNSAIIHFRHMGKTNSIYVPYHRAKSTAMLRQKVFLVREEEKIPLLQKPGVPFLVSAADLGGEKIIVENRKGEIIKEFPADQIPQLF